MTPERHRQIGELYHAAVAVAPDERTAFLHTASGSDAELLHEVQSLLNAHEHAGSFIAAPALDRALTPLADTADSSFVGRQVGPYTIQSLLGAGGMGEVYRAHDNKLGRDVAIKILPRVFTTDPERRARFEREARMLAALNHPHIGAIYGLEDADGISALVLELVEGETLAERLTRGSAVPASGRTSTGRSQAAGGALLVNETLEIARQIAEALEAAHERGIIHRDLKPANIKITPDGTVKVLDFGLARLAVSGVELDSTSEPIGSIGGTREGMILGTAAYMSPEQARGQPVDRRTDIWAFGCVLYEMLTGRLAFQGVTLTDTLATIVDHEPDWTRVPANVPRRILELLKRCLEKNAKSRWRDAGDVRVEIEHALAGEPAVDIRAVAPPPASRLAWIVAGAALLAVGLLTIPAVRSLRETTGPSPPEMRVQIDTPPRFAPLEFALSPEGRHIVFVASGDGPQRLWLRALDKSEARPIAGTDGADYPFWSADGRSIGFFSSGKLYRVDIAGGPPLPLADASNGRGGAWNAEGTILFAPTANGPLLRVAASADEQPVAVTRVDSTRQTGHIVPQFLPDGRHFLFYAYGGPQALGIYLGSLDGSEPKRLTAADTAGAYLKPDMVIFVQQSALVARHLDIQRGALTGDVMVLAESVSAVIGLRLGGFSVSADGSVAYLAGAARRGEVSWFDRTGKARGVVVAEPYIVGSLELSPDDQRVALDRVVQGNADVWLMEFGRGWTRFTVDPAVDSFGLWSPDGTRIVFASARKGRNQMYLKPSRSSGSGAEELVLDGPKSTHPLHWSQDGRFLLYNESDPETGRDLWVLPMTGTDRKPRVVVNTRFAERNGQFSPDGRWVAYETDESGRFETVVQRFPDLNGKWQVSTSGGTQPRWRADGGEIYFVAPDGKLMAASVMASGSTFEAGRPVPLFPTRMVGSSFKAQYAVSRDGRFLINQPAEETTATPVTLILNWKTPSK